MKNPFEASKQTSDFLIQFITPLANDQNQISSSILIGTTSFEQYSTAALSEDESVFSFLKSIVSHRNEMKQSTHSHGFLNLFFISFTDCKISN
jgi:hypothetical protein